MGIAIMSFAPPYVTYCASIPNPPDLWLDGAGVIRVTPPASSGCHFVGRFEGRVEHCANAFACVLAWRSRSEFLLWTIFLGIVPGFLCYIGYNVVLAFTSSLVVSMGLSICPLTGSLLGWFMGLTNLPNIYTIVGGSLTMAATIVVSWGTHPDEDKKEAEKIDIESRGSKGEDVEDKVPLLQDQRQP